MYTFGLDLVQLQLQLLCCLEGNHAEDQGDNDDDAVEQEGGHHAE